MANQSQEGSGTTREVTPRRTTSLPPQRTSTVPIYRRRRTRTRVRSNRSERSRSNPSYTNNDRSHGRRGAIMRRRSRTTSRPATPARPVTPPKPKIPDVNTYLKGDSTYQRQLASYAKSLSDFLAEQGLARTDYNTNYANTRRDIGLSKTDALSDLENDFAARGMLQSSLYSQGLGDLNQQYQNQYLDLDKARTSFLDQLAQDLTKYRGEQTVGTQNARAEAIRRRAEKYT